MYQRDGERGLTLIELLVAISLLAIATTLITTLVVTLAQNFSRQEVQQDNSRTTAVAMQQVGRVVRGATPMLHENGWQQLPAVSDARADRLRLSTYVDSESVATGPTEVELRLDAAAGDLIETRWASQRSSGVWVFDATPSRTRTILRDVLPAGAALASGETLEGLFQYVAADGRVLSIPAGGQLTAVQRSEVAAVRVLLAVQTAPGSRASAAVLRTTFSMPSVPDHEEEE